MNSFFYNQKKNNTSFFRGEYSQFIPQRFELAGSPRGTVFLYLLLLITPVTPASSTFSLPLDDAFVCSTGEPKRWLLTCQGRKAANALMAHWLLLMGRVWREPRAPHQEWPREWSQVRARCSTPGSLQGNQGSQPSFPSLSLVHVLGHPLGIFQVLGPLQGPSVCFWPSSALPVRPHSLSLNVTSQVRPALNTLCTEH